MEATINYLDKYSALIFVIQMGLLFVVTGLFTWIWYYNRRKYHNLKHQIPASVVKSYLDSIIQNSTSLKSSLFRGGGLDVDPSSIPSVMPLDQLQSGTQVTVAGGGDEALLAEIARLKTQLGEKETVISDLEAKNIDLSGEAKAKQERIEELEKLLAEAQANVGSDDGGGDDAALQAAVAAAETERDELKEKLAQYEIIEDDLADLKRLRQENEQLKEQVGRTAPAAEAPEAAPAAEAPAAEAPAAEAPAAEAPAAEAPAAEEDDKSPEDLLSEFEKMLG